MVKGGGDKRKLLVGILVGLAVIIVGLVVMIVVARSNSYEDEAQEQSDPEIANEDSYVKTAASEDTYMLTEELAGIYNEGLKDEAIHEYTENMAEALTDNDYDKFFKLLSSMSTVMVEAGDCEKLMGVYDGIDIAEMPASQQVYFYGTAAGAGANCGDTARRATYEAKKQQLYDSGEVENYEN